ncbi:histidine phosphatase family protein [Saccharibacillus sp. O16]|nr:histidine phosphatase family protein [Saccharibacillus sp. O16]
MSGRRDGKTAFPSTAHAPQSNTSPPASAERETLLYFVRHAHSVYEHGRELERGLSPSGEAEARALCARLSSEGIEQYISSPYRRAIDTIRPLAEAAGRRIDIHPDLRERLVSGSQDLGPEGFQEAKRRCYADLDYRPPGGESSREAQMRAVSVIRGLLHAYPGGRIAIGTHGDILTLMLGAFDERYGYSFWQSLTMPDAYRAHFVGERLVEVKKIQYESPIFSDKKG